jgi:5-hydroxyisourate hydrolase-like protein (transthyretin family)
MLSIAAALVITVGTWLGAPQARAASPQAAQPVQAPPLTRVTGRVVSGDPATGVPRALVTASANGKLVAAAMTDASGTFAIDAPASTASISVSKPGFVTRSRRAPDNRTTLTPFEIPLARAAVVSGRVLDAAGRPIVSIRVRIAPVNTAVGGQMTTAVTDDRGIFRIAGLNPGTYSIVSEGHPDYQSVIANRSPVSPSSKPLTIQVRERAENTVTLTYQDTAVILSYAEVGAVVTGHVVDEYGEPAPGLTVRLARVGSTGTTAGEFSNVPRLTDDRGEYRLFHIPAGQYFLMVSDDTSGSADEPAWLPVYFPGSLAAVDAIPLNLGRSTELAGMNIIFSRSRGTRLFGHVLNSAGQPLRSQVRLAAPVPWSGAEPRARIVGTREDGSFELGSVPPGRYTLHTTAPAVGAVYVTLAGTPPNSERVSRAPAESPREFGFLPVDAQGDELGPLVMQTSPGATVSGRLVLEAAPLSSRPAFTFVAVAASEHFPMSDQPLAMIQSTTDSELQSFRINGLAGTMRLRLGGGSNWWMKSASINGIDAVESPVVLTSPRESTNDAIIVLADTAGSVTGRAMSGQTPADDGWAIVFAADRSQRFTGSQRIVAMNLEDEGRFTASGLPPGDYYVAAVEGAAALPRNEARFLDLLDTLTSGARRVTIGPRQSVTLPQSVPAVAR